MNYTAIKKHEWAKRERRYMHSLRVSAPQIFIHYPGNNSNFTREKSAGDHLTQVIKVGITCNKLYWHHGPLTQHNEKRTPPLQYTKPQSNQEKTSNKLKLVSMLQNKWPVLFKSVRIMKDKERPRNCHKSEKLKGTEWLNVMWDPGLNAEIVKGQQWGNNNKKKEVKSKWSL